MPTHVSKAIVFLSCAATLIAGPASAQTPDKRVFYTFSGPVEIPGAVLPAGKYLFQLADPTTGRRVLEVHSADGKKMYGMFFTAPIDRRDIPKQEEVRFLEPAAGKPPAIATVWYFGEKTGRELIYPRDQAMRIAKATNHPVLTTQAPTTKADEAATGDLSRVSPAGKDEDIAANTPVETPTGRSQAGSDASAPVTVLAQNDTPRATTGREPARERLPRTASSTPLMLACGVGFLALAGAVRLRRTSRA